MSYTTKIKNEITEIGETRLESIAMLSAFIRNNGVIENNKLYLTTENISIRDMISKLLLDLYSIKVKIKVKNNLNFNKNSLFSIIVEDKVDIILKDLGYLDNKGNFLKVPPEYILSDNDEVRAYLRGVFLSQGSINDPKTSQYHMELLLDNPDEAIVVQRLLNTFDLNAKMLNRFKRYMIYIKEAEKISDFIKIIGAVKAVLYFEDIRTYHDKKNHTNRLNNCEQANTDKTISAAMEQLKNIEILEENLAIELLDDKTKEALEYRKKYPETSLKELSEIISLETNNKITKSGLNHRFRKINDLAEKLKQTNKDKN